MSMNVEVTTWYLEMLSPEQLRSKPLANDQLKVEQVEIASPEFSRFLYTSVGSGWYWIDRLTWTRDRWLQHLDRPELKTWVVYLSGTPAGYFELEAQPDRNTEIACFGIMPQFIGQKIGGYLLSVATEKAWSLSSQRVWVHTCSLDSPYALKNYQARGFQIYKQTTHFETSPEQPLGIW
jgi:ribosomal protein S18 acetylase RimI-like enzyme